jgi:tetraacyldisaccharide-1-P 4'-kinase
VVVLVDKNRVKAGAYAIKRFGCDTLVLDDGMQYLPLKGRLNLLLVARISAIIIMVISSDQRILRFNT